MRMIASPSTLLICLIAVLGIGFSPLGAYGGSPETSLHGEALATINDDGHLIIALDRYHGPSAAEDGIADRVIVFAPDSDQPLTDTASLLTKSDQRVNLELTETYERTVLRLHVPGFKNIWLAVPKQLPETRDLADQDGEPGMIKGKALSVMDVSWEKQTLEETLSAYRDFPILGGEFEGIDPHSTWCAAGGYCASQCSIQAGPGECSVTCAPNFYACCTYTGCHCNVKNGTDPQTQS